MRACSKLLDNSYCQINVACIGWLRCEDMHDQGAIVLHMQLRKIQPKRFAAHCMQAVLVVLI